MRSSPENFHSMKKIVPKSARLDSISWEKLSNNRQIEFESLGGAEKNYFHTNDLPSKSIITWARCVLSHSGALSCQKCCLDERRRAGLCMFLIIIAQRPVYYNPCLRPAWVNYYQHQQRTGLGLITRHWRQPPPPPKRGCVCERGRDWRFYCAKFTARHRMRRR